MLGELRRYMRFFVRIPFIILWFILNIYAAICFLIGTFSGDADAIILSIGSFFQAAATIVLIVKCYKGDYDYKNPNIALLIITIALVWVFSWVNYDFSENKYNSFATSSHILPATNDIGKYTAVKTKYYKHRRFWFVTESYTLKATYDDTEFQNQLDLINGSYKFQQNVITQEERDWAAIPNTIYPSFTLDGFYFRLLDLNEYGCRFPQELYFIGFNEAKNKIVYISFKDCDVNFINSQFDVFLKEECDWKTWL